MNVLKSRNVQLLIAALVFSVGNGVYWQWQSSRLAAKQHHLRILEERSVVYQRLAEEFDKYKSLDACQGEKRQEVQRLTTNLSLLRDRFQALRPRPRTLRRGHRATLSRISFPFPVQPLAPPELDSRSFGRNRLGRCALGASA